MSEGYWDGALWVYHSQIAHEGGQGAGDITWLVVPGAGNELEILYGHLHNTDTSTRVASGIIETDTAGEEVTPLFSDSLGAAARQVFFVPSRTTATEESAGGPRYIVAGTMRLLFTMAAVADGQESIMGIACRIRGGVPTVTEGGQGTIVITELTEQVF